MRRFFDADFGEATGMLDCVLRPVSETEDLDAASGVDAHRADDDGIVRMAHAATPPFLATRSASSASIFRSSA